MIFVHVPKPEESRGWGNNRFNRREQPRVLVKMSQVEFLRAFMTERLTAASQEVFAAVDKIVAGYEAEASGFRQEIERQRNLLDVLLQPRVALNKTGPCGQDQLVSCTRSAHETHKDPGPDQLLDLSCDQQLSKIETEDPPELTTSLDQENPESLHIKEEEEEILTTPTFSLGVLHVKSEDEEEKPQSLQPHPRETKIKPPSSSSAEQMEADGDDCGGSEPARNSDQPEDLQPDPDDEVSEWSCETEDSDDDWSPSESRLKSEANVNDEECNTGKKSHRCSDCGETFSTTWVLKRHMRIHAEEKQFDCATCGKKFRKRWVLQEHMRIHTGEKPFECRICGKRFSYIKSLSIHMRVHTDEKTFSCALCGQKFAQQIHCLTHTSVHSKAKPFGCSVCGKTFMEPVNFVLHLKCHREGKVFGCNDCGEIFSQYDYLEKHMKVHTEVKPFDCSVVVHMQQ